MELKGTFIPQFQISLPITRLLGKKNKRPRVFRIVRVSSSFRETFPLSYRRWRTIEVQCSDSPHNIHGSPVSQNNITRLPELAFNRLQLSDQELCGGQRRTFGRFVARGALLDEEYWTAAWLRAEAHYESLSYMRHVDSYKRKYAEEEFYGLKRRCSGQEGNSLKCFCIVAVKKEEKNVRRTVLNSVVGTLDVSIRQFLQGETLPGEVKRPSAILMGSEAYDAHRYAYVANVCVSKYARRQGIASNLLYLATDVAISAGMKQLFVRVNADNKPAQDLYRKTGFELVDAAPLLKGQRLLMCMELKS